MPFPTLKELFFEEKRRTSKEYLLDLYNQSKNGKLIFAHWSFLPNKLGPNPKGHHGGTHATPWGLYGYRLDLRTLGALEYEDENIKAIHPHANINPQTGGKEEGFERPFVHIFEITDPSKILFLSGKNYTNFDRDRKTLLKLVENGRIQAHFKTFGYDVTRSPEKVYEEAYNDFLLKMDPEHRNTEDVLNVAEKIATNSKKSHFIRLAKIKKESEEELEKYLNKTSYKTSDASKIYFAVRQIVGPNTRAWSLLLNKMGYFGAYDDGTATIYYGQERDQIVIFRMSIVRHLATFSLRGRQKIKKHRRNISRVV